MVEKTCVQFPFDSRHPWQAACRHTPQKQKCPHDFGFVLMFNFPFLENNSFNKAANITVSGGCMKETTF